MGIACGKSEMKLQKVPGAYWDEIKKWNILGPGMYQEKVVILSKNSPLIPHMFTHQHTSTWLQLCFPSFEVLFYALKKPSQKLYAFPLPRYCFLLFESLFFPLMSAYIPQFSQGLNFRLQLKELK